MEAQTGESKDSSELDLLRQRITISASPQTPIPLPINVEDDSTDSINL
ncbi:13411_t:CDS:2 [Entrophospora sp. SA101]|nr:13411_t:CDS:2 [Entrophospora sp. SA101]